MNAAYNNLKRSSFRAAQRVDRKVVLLGKNEMPHSIRFVLLNKLISLKLFLDHVNVTRSATRKLIPLKGERIVWNRTN